MPSMPQAPANKRTSRLANIEFLRVLAMIDIVGFHLGSNDALWLGGLGLPTFLLLTNVFNCTTSQSLGFAPFAHRKADRLIVPFLAWCLVYGVFRLVKATHHAIPLSQTFNWRMLLSGTHYHLWFVPFALAAGILTGFIQHVTARLPHRPVLFASALLGTTLMFVDATCLSVWPSEELAMPVGQYLFALPSIFLGFAIGRVQLIESPTDRWHTVLILCAGAVLCGLIASRLDIHSMALRYSIMVVFVSAAFTWPGRSNRLLRYLTPLLFGIYLIHPAIIELTRYFHPLWHVCEQNGFIATIVVFILSALLTHGIRRTPLRKTV